MQRVADPTLFRAAGVILDWDQILRARKSEEGRYRPQIRLAWACNATLGVPATSFRVLVGRPENLKSSPVEPQWHATAEGWHVFWDGTPAAEIQLICRPNSADEPIGVFALRTGHSVSGAIAAASAGPTRDPEVRIQVRTAGATSFVLVGAEPGHVSIIALDDVISQPEWVEMERVGLPIGEDLGAYRADEQGTIWAPMPPPDAAVERLRRAGPPVGWWPMTESGRIAPPWSPPDPHRLVDEVAKFLLPELKPLFDGRPESSQHRFVVTRSVAPPSQGAELSDQPASATLAPLHSLLLAGGGDAFNNLALGFGTGYGAEDFGLLKDINPRLAKGGVDFLIVGHYQDSVLGADVAVCAYVPRPQQHQLVPGVVDLTADRAALVPPVQRDAPFTESIELSWLPRQGRPWLTDPIAVSAARFDPLTAWGAAADALPARSDGGSGFATLSRPTRLEGHEGSERPRHVDLSQPLPPSGEIRRGYAVAVANIFGLYSSWQDVELTTNAPPVQGARVVSVSMTTQYAGSHLCPAELVTELTVPWVERTPVRLELVALFYPMPTGDSAPPAAQPWQAAVGLRRTFTDLTFTGEELSCPGGTVTYLGGSAEIVAAGSAQGSEGRRYRVTMPTEPLDFAGVSRWGVRVWLRLHAAGVTAPSAWTPAPEAPAIAVAASPVPAIPSPPKRLPGVPLGSTLDPAGCSHAAVQWPTMTGPHVHRIVVWETTETALLWKLRKEQPSEADLPGARLQRLFDVYNGVDGDAETVASRRQGCFRRVMELESSATSADVVLPKGSRDIHLFVVTATTTTGVDSPWPTAMGDVPASAHLHPVMAPRVVQPSPPRVRPAVQADGSTQLTIEAVSDIRMAGFEIFASRSEVAARDHWTMGPPVKTVPAGDPTEDPFNKAPVYKAAWSVMLPENWDPWMLRVVAVPHPVVPELAQRGRVSDPSDLVVVTRPPSTPPVLERLIAEFDDGDPLRLRIRSATSAPRHAVPAGSFTIDASVDGVSIPAQPLHELSLAQAATAPPTLPALQQLQRHAGSTPLVLLTSRATPETVVQVTLRLIDPLGREAVESLTVDGYAPPVRQPDIRIVNVATWRGRGRIVTIHTAGEPGDMPPWTVALSASAPGAVVLPPLPTPLPPRFPQHTPGFKPLAFDGHVAKASIFPPWFPKGSIPVDASPVWRRRTWSASWLLSEIKQTGLAGGPVPAIEATRRGASDGGTEVTIFLPSTAIDRISVTISSEAGSASDSWSA